MIRKGLLFFLLSILLNPNGYGQDPEFSQFYAAPLYLNPALTGISHGPRVNLNYRNQWPSLEKAYTSFAASFDLQFDQINSGFGLLFLGDRIANGLLNSYSIKLLYAYQIKLSRKVGIKIGVEGGYTFKQVDKYRLTFPDMIDNIYGFENEFGLPNPTNEDLNNIRNIHMPDFGAGFIVYSRIIYGGFAVKHVNRPKDSFLKNQDSKLPLRFTVHAGGDIHLVPKYKKKNIFISPNILLTQQSNFSQLNVGTYVNINMIYAGFWYRHTFSNSDAVIALLGFRYKYVKLAYSYDFTISRLKAESGGTHEISFAFNLGGDNNSKKQDRLECPSFLNF